MIDIPLGKALVPVKRTTTCEKCKSPRCVFWAEHCCDLMDCYSHERKDGKDVIFKLVDYPVEG